jgi:hypothetical protein
MPTPIKYLDQTNTEIESIDLCEFHKFSEKTQNYWINILKNFKNVKELTLEKYELKEFNYSNEWFLFSL